jgi:murein DD-endopeptidase MepM/ murein hydrolase activator NlpD
MASLTLRGAQAAFEQPAASELIDNGGEQAAAPQQPAAYFTHEVREGETLSSIAEMHGVGLDYLIWNNPEVGDPDMLIVGAKLLIPGVDGIVYDVRLGDTINGISARYGIDPQEVVSFAPNELDSPDHIIEGMVLVLPGGVPPAPPPPEPAPEAEPEPAAPAPALPGPGIVSAPTPPPAPAGLAAPAAASSAGYIWPLSGPVWSGFGPRWGSFHKGIDIGAPYGTPVAAAAAGQVILATYKDNGYGNYVIVRHADGSETLYAHLSSIHVSLGEYVVQGQSLGGVGCTGWCLGNHLHFEIIIGGVPVNPLLYLP